MARVDLHFRFVRLLFFIKLKLVDDKLRIEPVVQLVEIGLALLHRKFLSLHLFLLLLRIFLHLFIFLLDIGLTELNLLLIIIIFLFIKQFLKRLELIIGIRVGDFLLQIDLGPLTVDRQALGQLVRKLVRNLVRNMIRLLL